jgi:hypothetical protein
VRVDELFELNPEWTGARLSQELGYTGAESVNSRRRNGADIPDAWYPKLAELGLNVGGWTPGADEASEYRESDAAPVAPADAPRQTITPTIDYSAVAGYIEGAYRLASQMAVRQSDPLLAAVIDEHAAAAGVAWAHWVESEPKVAALLQRMMIGTPLGEVIGVHVGIVFSYTLARGAAREIAADVAGRDADAFDGSPPAPPEDQLA